MAIADTLNEAKAVVEHDSRVVPIAVPNPDGGCEWIATTGRPRNPDYGIVDVTQEKHAGHWVTIVYGEDGSTAWWDDSDECWLPGLPE